MKHHEAGKGSRQRPGSGYADGWDAIWGNKMKWLPIETAPRNGERFIASAIGWEIVWETQWRDETYPGPNCLRGFTRTAFEDRGTDFNPTHWMPLPEPPESN